jgi:hypothetical protein
MKQREIKGDDNPYEILAAVNDLLEEKNVEIEFDDGEEKDGYGTISLKKKDMTGRDLIKYILDHRMEGSKFCFQLTKKESVKNNYQPWFFLQESMLRAGSDITIIYPERDIKIIREEKE